MSFKPTEAQKAAVVQKALAQKNSSITTTKQINTVQTTLANAGLGERTKKAQQELSDKYGIPTFDVKGFISTVPASGEINKDINVGTGALTPSAFQKSLEVLIRNQQQSGGSGGAGALAAITAPITTLIDILLPKTDYSDLTDDQKKQIATLDAEIAKWTAEAERLGTEASRNAGIYQQFLDAVAKRNEFTNAKNTILQKYRAANQIIKEIQEVQKKLLDLAKVTDITQQLKDDIQTTQQDASALIEKVLREGLEVPKSVITELNKAQLAANAKFKEEIKEAQKDTKENVDVIGGFLNQFNAFFNALNAIFNPPVEVMVEQQLKQGRAMKIAIQKAKSEGLI